MLRVRSVVAALVGDWESARKVSLELPETGVCTTTVTSSTTAEASLDEVVAPRGVRVTRFEGTEIEDLENALQPDTKEGYLETLTNPSLSVIDIERVASIAHASRAL